MHPSPCKNIYIKSSSRPERSGRMQQQRTSDAQAPSCSPSVTSARSLGDHLCKKLDGCADTLLTATVMVEESHNSSLVACQVRISKSVIARTKFSKTRVASSVLRGVYRQAHHRFADCCDVALPDTFDWSVGAHRPVGNAVRLK